MRDLRYLPEDSTTNTRANKSYSISGGRRRRRRRRHVFEGRFSAARRNAIAATNAVAQAASAAATITEPALIHLPHQRFSCKKRCWSA